MLNTTISCLSARKKEKQKKQKRQIQNETEVFGNGYSSVEKKARESVYQAFEDTVENEGRIENLCCDSCQHFRPGSKGLHSQGHLSSDWRVNALRNRNSYTEGNADRVFCFYFFSYFSYLEKTMYFCLHFLFLKEFSVSRGFAVICQAGQFLTFLENSPSYTCSVLCNSAWKLPIKSFHSTIYKSLYTTILNFKNHLGHLSDEASPCSFFSCVWELLLSEMLKYS